jgi:spoIIIJ-associated protein
MVKEWVEATGSTVDIAVQAALQELGLESREQALVEIIKEGKPGILGSSWRAEDAVVKVMAKPPERKRRRRRGRGGKQQENGEARGKTQRSDRKQPDRDQRVRGEKGGAAPQQRSGGAQEGGETRPRRSPKEVDESRSRGGSEARDRPRAERSGGSEGAAREEEASIEEQAKVAEDFVKGLLGAFGLEGTVTTTIDDDILKIEVTGDQTEALVGRKGVIMHAVLEITRTVVQRKTFGAPRMRIDINGYAERRREALKIYATRQAERVLEEGGEVMLEPMNAADRKVVHDAVAEIAGVASYSEGEDPDRAVVISKDAADTAD